MTPINSYKTFDLIDIFKIDYDERYRFDKYSLKNNYKKISLEIPLLLKKVNNNYNILEGHDRFLELKNTNKFLQAYIIDTNDEEIILNELIQYKNLCFPLDLIEKAYLIQYLNVLNLEKSVIDNVLGLIDEHLSKKTIQDYVKISQLDSELQKWLSEKGINKKLALEWCYFEKADQKRILEIITRFNIGINKAKIILESFKFITKRDSKKLSQILRDEQLEAIFNDDKEKDNNVLQNRFLIRLKQIKNPEYEKTMETIQNYIKRLELPPQIKISTNPSLEGKGLLLEAIIKDEVNFKKLIDKLTENYEKNIINELFRVVN